MSIEGFGFYNNEEPCIQATYTVTERNWNGRKVSFTEDNIANLIKGYPSQKTNEIISKILSMKGSAGGSIDGKADSKGNSSIEGEIHVSSKDTDGNKVSATAEGSIKNDSEGNTRAEGGFKISYEREF